MASARWSSYLRSTLCICYVVIAVVRVYGIFDRFSISLPREEVVKHTSHSVENGKQDLQYVAILEVVKSIAG